MEESLAKRAPADSDRWTRRQIFERFGWTGLSLLLLASIPGTFRFLLSRAGRGDAGLVECGSLADYGQSGVVTRWAARHRLWIVRRNGRLFALEAKCTHLGCTPRWEPSLGLFHCPCHGSRFTQEGEVLNGPATRPLARLAIRVEHEQVLVDPSRRAPLERAESDPRFHVTV